MSEYKVMKRNTENRSSEMLEERKFEEREKFRPLNRYSALQGVVGEIMSGQDIRENLERIMMAVNSSVVPCPTDLLCIFPVVLTTLEENSEDDQLVELCFAVLVFLSHSDFETEMCPFLSPEFGHILVKYFASQDLYCPVMRTTKYISRLCWNLFADRYVKNTFMELLHSTGLLELFTDIVHQRIRNS